GYGQRDGAGADGRAGGIDDGGAGRVERGYLERTGGAGGPGGADLVRHGDARRLDRPLHRPGGQLARHGVGAGRLVRGQRRERERVGQDARHLRVLAAHAEDDGVEGGVEDVVRDAERLADLPLDVRFDRLLELGDDRLDNAFLEQHRRQLAVLD